MTGPSLMGGEVAYDFVGRDKVTPVAQQVKRSLHEALPPADAPSKFEQLSTAMGRIERREPTMVLRQMRGAIDEVAASALGAGGPIGRMVGTFGMFTGGMGAVAAVAAVGLEIKKIIDFTNSLDTNLKAVNDKFAAMVPMAKTLGEIATSAKTLTDVGAKISATGEVSTDRSFLSKFLRTDIGNMTPKPGELGGFSVGIPGLTDIATAMDVSRNAQAATEENMLRLQMDNARKQREAIVSQRTGAPTALQGVETRNKEMRSLAEASELAAAKLQLAQQGITDVSDPKYAARIEEIRAKFQGITSGVGALAKATKDAADKQAELSATMARTAEGVVSAGIVFGAPTHQRQLVDTHVATGPLGPQAGNKGAMTMSAAIEAQTASAAVGAGIMATNVNRPGQSPMAEEVQKLMDRLTGALDKFKREQELLDAAFAAGQISAQQYADATKKLGEEQGRASKDAQGEKMGRAVGDMFSHMAAAAVAGGQRAGQIMAQAVATMLESATKDLTAHMSGFSAGFVSAGVGILSGILGSLFGGGTPTVMIDGYSSKALSQQQTAMLAVFGFKGLNIDVMSGGGGSTAATLYALGRQGRTDGMMNVPPTAGH